MERNDAIVGGTGDAAKILKRGLRAIQRAARIHKIGRVIARRRVFTLEDVERLRDVTYDKPGNPWSRHEK